MEGRRPTRRSHEAGGRHPQLLRGGGAVADRCGARRTPGGVVVRHAHKGRRCRTAGPGGDEGCRRRALLLELPAQKTIDKTAVGNLVSLIGFEKEQSYVRPDDDYKVTILFDTNLKEDVAMFAYDTNGAVIQRNNFPAMFSRGMQQKNACIIWSPDGTSKKDFCTREGEVLSAKYPEKPTKIEVHISKMATQKFPFTLTK